MPARCLTREFMLASEVRSAEEETAWPNEPSRRSAKNEDAAGNNGALLPAQVGFVVPFSLSEKAEKWTSSC